MTCHRLLLHIYRKDMGTHLLLSLLGYSSKYPLILYYNLITGPLYGSCPILSVTIFLFQLNYQKPVSLGRQSIQIPGSLADKDTGDPELQSKALKHASKLLHNLLLHR